MDIRPLAPDLADDFFALFDASFTDNPDWCGCYCQFYEVETPAQGWDTTDPDVAAANRSDRRAATEAGTVSGLLAFEGGRAVGWLSAQPRSQFKNLRSFSKAVEPADPSIGSIMCFVIHPDHRRQGVATALLVAADDHLRSLGCTVAEGYPRPEDLETGDPFTSNFYKGTPSMFAAAGYRLHRRERGFSVVRKDL